MEEKAKYNKQEVEKFSLKSRAKSFTYAFKGLVVLFKKEHNSRIHITAAILVIALGFILDISPQEWISISIVIALVLLSELFNTAIERLADVVDPNWNKLIGEVKDYAAAAALIAALVAVVVGAIIFVPKLI